MSSHLPICILPREGPLYAATLSVAPDLPGIDFVNERGSVGQASVKALAVEDADFNFRHVEPTGVLWGVVEYYAPQQRFRLFDTEHFLEALGEMGVEVVHDQVDTTRRSVDIFEQVPNEGNEVRLGTAISHDNGTSCPLRFHCHEKVAGAGAGIFVIVLRRRPWLDRQWCAGVPEQLFAFFVQANDGLSRTEWASIEVEQVVHTLSVFLCQDAYAPHHLAPRFDAVFLEADEWSPG